jgi:hypothetical protein
MPTAFSVRLFEEIMLVGMVEAFKNRSIEFVSLVDITESKGQTVYRLSSQFMEWTDVMANRVTKMVHESLVPGFDQQQAKDRHRAEVASILSDFQISGQLDFSQSYNCVRLRCDARSKTASIQPFKARSTRPQDYEGRLATTSELLEYVAALYNSGPILDAGDPFWITSYSWVKFFTSFLENRAIDFADIRVNDADPEEWDFINTELDYEIESAKR